MIKKLLLFCVISLLFLSVSCDWAEGGVEIIDNTPGEDLLVNMVFAGEDSAGNWITVAFREEKSAACFFAYETTGYDYYKANYNYSYDKNTGSGSITDTVGPQGAESNGSQFTYGAFTIVDSGAKLVFVNGTTLLCVRDAAGMDLPVPFSATNLPSSGSLDGTVWAATGFRTKDWTTLSIVSSGAPDAGTITVSHSFDASSFNRDYSNYDPTTGRGNLAYIGPFEISGDTFTFTNFYGHGGAVPFKRMR
jgi:hypothetical protein